MKVFQSDSDASGADIGLSIIKGVLFATSRGGRRPIDAPESVRLFRKCIGRYGTSFERGFVPWLRLLEKSLPGAKPWPA